MMRYPETRRPGLSLFSRFFSKNAKRWSIRWALAFFLAVSTSLVFNHLQITNQIASYLDGNERLRQTQKTNDALRKEIKQLERSLSDISNPAWVEIQARERGMIRPNEQVYRVTRPHVKPPDMPLSTSSGNTNE